MGKPALRIGDLTAHGGTVTVGKPNILIGKMPASTLGDMHVCPMLTGPVPHVGGPAIMGSTGVMLSKMPAARVSDPHVCVGPPSMGAMGCMTVLLGEAGSGGDAGNAAAAVSAASMSKKGPKAISPFPVAEAPTPRTENHYLECKVTDDGNFVVAGIRYKIKDPYGNGIIGSTSFEGRVRHSGYVQAGSFKIEFPAIAKVKWPSLKNKPHEKLKLEASVTGFLDGTEAYINIFEERDRGKYKRLIEDLRGKVSGGKVAVEWTFAKEHYPLPKQDESKMHPLEEKPEGKIEYFFFVVVEGCIGVSKKAQFLEDAEILVVDKDKKPMANEEYSIWLIDGSVRKGKLDKDAKVKVKDIPAGPYTLKLPGIEKKPEVAKKKMPEAKSPEKAAHRRKGQKVEESPIEVGSQKKKEETAPLPESIPQSTEQKNESKIKEFISIQDGEKIVAAAKKWIGTPYLTVGNNKEGADCSGSVWGIYHDAEMTFPRVSSYDFPNLTQFIKSPNNQPQIGDIGYWPGHLMIFDSNAGTTSKGEIANGWSATHPNGKAFNVARYQWFDSHYKTSVIWFRFLK